MPVASPSLKSVVLVSKSHPIMHMQRYLKVS